MPLIVDGEMCINSPIKIRYEDCPAPNGVFFQIKIGAEYTTLEQQNLEPEAIVRISEADRPVVITAQCCDSFQPGVAT